MTEDTSFPSWEVFWEKRNEVKTYKNVKHNQALLINGGRLSGFTISYQPACASNPTAKLWTT